MNFKAIIIQFTSILKNKGLIDTLTYLGQGLSDKYIKKYLRGSYSQKGEDLVIEKIFGKKKSGFYIDVGAHNASVFNNTKRLYDMGWRGINIEPNPLLLKKITSLRKGDINLNIGVGKTPGSAVFYELDPDSLSTFSKKEKDMKIKLGYRLKKKHKIKVFRLENIINKYVKTKVDFISIDTEGLDLEVLQSNNWIKYKPFVICVETGDFNSIILGEKSKKKKTIDSYLEKHGYEDVYSNGLNSIYKKM